MLSVELAQRTAGKKEKIIRFVNLSVNVDKNYGNNDNSNSDGNDDKYQLLLLVVVVLLL